MLSKHKRPFSRFESFFRVASICALLLAVAGLFHDEQKTSPSPVAAFTPIETTCATTYEKLLACLEAGGRVDLPIAGTVIIPDMVIEQDTRIRGLSQQMTVFSGEHKSSTLFTVAPGAKLTLENIRIKDAQIGIYVQPGGKLIVRNCYFSGNGQAAMRGAAIWNEGGVVEITSCLFEGNSTAFYGGTVVNAMGGRLRITGTIFRDNTSDKSASAIFNSGNAQIEDVSFEGNTSTSFGNVIRNQFGLLSLKRAVFRQNQTSGVAIVMNQYATGILELQSATFIYNKSRVAMIYNEGTLRLIEPTFQTNEGEPCQSHIQGTLSAPDNLCTITKG